MLIVRWTWIMCFHFYSPNNAWFGNFIILSHQQFTINVTYGSSEEGRMYGFPYIL